MTETLKLFVPAENVKEVEIKGNKMCQIDTGCNAEQFMKYLSRYIATEKEIVVLRDDI